MSMKLPTQCPAKSARLVKCYFPSFLNEAVNSCVSLDIVHLFIWAEICKWSLPLILTLTGEALINVFQGHWQEILVRQLWFNIPPFPSVEHPNRMHAACTHFLNNQQWFCCVHLPALLQWASSVGWRLTKGGGRCGAVVRDVIENLPLLLPSLLPHPRNLLLFLNKLWI